MKTKDGGPAFATIDRPMYDKDEHHPGLSKLEWFAGMALIALAGDPRWISGLDREAEKARVEFKGALANEAFTMANAMLAESERRTGE